MTGTTDIDAATSPEITRETVVAAWRDQCRYEGREISMDDFVINLQRAIERHPPGSKQHRKFSAMLPIAERLAFEATGE